MNDGPAPVALIFLAIYAFGVGIALITIDAPWPARVGLALLWPLGPLAFLATISILLVASLIAFPIIGAIVLALVLAIVAFAQPPPALEARFIGNMAFAITDGAVTLFSDFPYQPGYSVYMEYDARDIRSSTPRSLALITHRHGDHWDKELFLRTNWVVTAPADALAGVPADRIAAVDPVGTFGPIVVEALDTPHANIGHRSYVVTWHGRRLYFTGDTESLDRLLMTTDLDVAFVSPWLFRQALKRGARIEARRIVIYHHEAGEQVPECAGTCSVPKQGEALWLR